jgi:hypothetical protein
MPDGDGTWTETVIHGFKGSPTDGAVPVGGLTWGKWGDLYGVTSQGGLARGDDEGNGIVFESEP